MTDFALPIPVMAFLHPAVWVNFLFVLQTCAWTVWAVAIFTGPEPRIGAGGWRWFGTGALLKVLAISAVSFLSQATAIDREWLRDAIYPAFSLAAVICWARHAWLADGARRGERIFLCLISGYTVAATLALGRWSWAAWPWVAGAPVLLAGAWLAACGKKPGWLRAAYAGWALLGLMEWAGPCTVFSWYANFTPDLAPTWDNHAAWFPPDAPLFQDGQLFMHVEGLTQFLFTASSMLAWAAFFCWWRWLGGGGREDGPEVGAVTWFVPLMTALFTFAGFFIYNASMVTAAGVVRHEVTTRTDSLASLLRGGMSADEARRLLAPHADIGRWQLVTLTGGVIRAVSDLEIPEAEGMALPGGVLGPVARAEATWWGPLRVDGRMFFYGLTPLVGEGEPWWLLLRQDYDYGGYYRRPLALSAGAVVGLGGLAGAFMLAFWTRRERELRQRGARARAEEGERLQTELLATLSHDVRTPLQSLLAYGDLLAGTSLDERQADYLRALREQANGLKHLWGNLLHLGMAGLKPESGAEPFSLTALVGEMGRSGEVLAGKRGLRFELILDDDLPGWVSGDEVRLRQVLINLLHNAVNYTDRGWVRFDVRLEAWDESMPGRAWILFVVEDSGPGLSEANRACLQGLPVGRRSESRGFGLGLPLVGRLTLLMGGAVVADGRPGEGSRIEVRLPFGIAEAKPAESVERSAEGGLCIRDLLLVEDHAEAGRALAESLRIHGFDVVWVRTVAEARGLWAGRRFHAAVIDGSLPDGSGLSLVRAWRKQARGRVVLLGLSATSGEEARSEWLEAGADELLAKPVEPAELARRLGRSPRAEVNAPPRNGPLDWNAELAAMRASLRDRDPGAAGRIHYLRTSALLRGDAPRADILARMEKAVGAGRWAEAESLDRQASDDGGDSGAGSTGENKR